MGASSGRVCDCEAPLLLPDGRIYDVLTLRLLECQGRAWRVCELDVLEREGQEFYPFVFCFYESAQGWCEAGDPAPLLMFARRWAWRFLAERRHPLRWSRWDSPVVVDCR